MNRNGLVFVPREPPKRVILYPTQDSANQQQQVNGSSTRAKTALVTSNHHETIEQSNNNNIRLSRQQPFSISAHQTTKVNERPVLDNNKSVPITAGQATTTTTVTSNVGQKLQVAYNGNPFFRPKVIPNQQLINHDSSAGNSNTNIQAIPPTATIASRDKPSISLLAGGRTQDTETTVSASSAPDENPRWAHVVPAAAVARRAINDERPNGKLQSSETNITSLTNHEPLKQKVTSATDIVISLMDTWRAPINMSNTPAVSIFSRSNGIKDDSTIVGPPPSSGDHLPNTPPFLNAGNNSAASNNNQNWKKALLANFQKNSRNIPTAKLFNSKQTAAPPQPSTTLNNDTAANQPQQQKYERTIFNGISNERTFQASETTRSIVKKSSESLKVTKPNDNNNNSNNVERSASLQIQASSHTNQVVPTANKAEETNKPIETSNADIIQVAPISVPAGLVTPKPPANVEQQRAIITRVMIRRDFVKTTESKPPMPSAANIRSIISSKSATPGGLSANNIVQVATITDNNSAMNSNMNANRIYSAQTQPVQQHLMRQQQQPSMPLSQKSLLTFSATTPVVRESVKVDLNQQQSNGTVNDATASTTIVPIMKTSQTPVPSNNTPVLKTQTSVSSTNTPTYRSSSVSATNAELKRKKEEINNKIKKRAISASAASNDG